MLELIYKGIKRRGKEIRYVSFVTFTAVLFLTAITLFQGIMNHYIMQKNLNTYGNWIVSTTGNRLAHPYFKLESSCTTGASLVDIETMMDNNITIGTAAENFDLVDGSNLYEGRMPEADHEIVMDTVTLAKFGYSYELGQTVSVDYRTAEGLVAKKEYELVGIIKCFSQIWRTSGTPLPNCFVTETEFKNYKQNSITTYYYQLDPQYNKINARDFAYKFLDADVEGKTVFNSYVYENQLWGTSDIYDKVTMALMAVSALAISYLMIAYTGKRRSVYYRYRCIGASQSQVRKIILTECVYATAPQILLGIAVSYFIAFVACKWMAYAKDMVDFYKFDGELFVGQILATVGVVFVAIAATQFSISDKRLAGNTGAVKSSKYRKLRRIAKRSKQPEKTIFKRQNALRPIQNLISAMFSIVVCAVLIFCLNRIKESYDETTFVLKTREDFTMQAFDEHWFDVIGSEYDERHGYQDYNMYLGANDVQMEQFRMCPGVKEVAYGFHDGLHYFTWDGMGNSKLRNQLVADSKCGTPIEYTMEMSFYDDMSVVKEHLENWGGEYELDWDKFEAGELIILSVNAFDWMVGAAEIGERLEDTLKTGDMLTINNSLTGIENVSVEIGLLIEDGKRNFTALTTEGYYLLGSKALAEKIAKSEGEELRHNLIEITYDLNASYQSTEKQLSKLAKDYDLKYFSQSEEIRIYKQKFMREFVIYGIVFLMVAFIYVTIQRSFLASKNKYWQSRFVLLKQIGMEDEQYFKLAFWEECKTYLWIFVGMIPGYMLSGYAMYLVWGALADEENTWIQNSWNYAMNRMTHWMYIAMAFLLYIVVILGSAKVIHNCIKEHKK